MPPDDPATYDLITSGDTLGTFQLESPGQREMVQNLRPRTFGDLALDISLFRPGPVAANMVEPLIKARDGQNRPRYPHPDLKPILKETEGQVVFHEQVIAIMTTLTGCDRGMADEARRALSNPERQSRVRAWFADRARKRGYPVQAVRDVWKILEGFGSFGFAKAHAAAFAQPAYQSSWLKAHRMAALLAGLLTHDPGMYHKRVLAADARRHGVPLLLPDINHSQAAHIIELVSGKWGVRIGLSQVRGITEAENGRITAGQPYASLEDFWQRARPSRPLAERLAQVGALAAFGPRRELVLKVTELHRSGRSKGGSTAGQLPMENTENTEGADTEPNTTATTTGLLTMSSSEQLAAELDVLSMDISHHLLDEHRSLLAEIGATPPPICRAFGTAPPCSSPHVKVATQTPPIHSGKRVIFATLDDPTGLSDLAFFEDSHARCAHTVFHSSLLLVRGTLARRPPRAFSITGTAAWDLAELIGLYREGGPAAVADRLTRPETAARRAGPRRTITQSTGYALHPWADLQPPGTSAAAALTVNALDTLKGRSFHHASPGSAG